MVKSMETKKEQDVIMQIIPQNIPGLWERCIFCGLLRPGQRQLRSLGNTIAEDRYHIRESLIPGSF